MGGTQIFSPALSQRRADGISRSLRAAPIQMPVHANRCLNRLVSEMLLDNREWHASLDHPGRASVPKVVHARRLRQSSFHRAVATGLPSEVEKFLRTNRVPRAIRKQEARDGQVNRVKGSSWQTDRADRLLRLRRADLRPVVSRVFPRLIYSACLRIRVNVGGGQRGCLREPHPRRDQPERKVLPTLPRNVIVQQPELRRGVRKTVSSTRVCGSRRPSQGLDVKTPARTAALNAPDKNPCLLEMVLPLPPSPLTQRAIVDSVTVEMGIEPNTGSMSRTT